MSSKTYIVEAFTRSGKKLFISNDNTSFTRPRYTDSVRDAMMFTSRDAARAAVGSIDSMTQYEFSIAATR